jgi:hypothetical protein
MMSKKIPFPLQGVSLQNLFVKDLLLTLSNKLELKANPKWNFETLSMKTAVCVFVCSFFNTAFLVSLLQFMERKVC